MKSYNGLYNAMLQHGEIVCAIREAAEGKRKRPVVIKTLANIDETADRLAEKVKAGKWEPPKHRRKKLEEGPHRKKRMIEKPRWNDEQIMHHVLMRPFKPIVLRSLYRYAYGSIPTQVIPLKTPVVKGKKVISCHVVKRGPLDAARTMKRWRDEYKGRKFYSFEGDIKSFYDSIDKPILKAMLGAKIRDRLYLRELFKVIDGSGPGLAKGFYTSPWLAHFYLTPLDNFITQQLRPDHYLRYMDNLFIFHKNKKELHKMVREIQRFLWERLRLKLNNSRQVYRFEHPDRKARAAERTIQTNTETAPRRKQDPVKRRKQEKTKGRAVNCLGYVIHWNRVTLRKSILKRTRAKANRMKKSGRCRRLDAAAMLSRMGWITHSDTYGYYTRYIRPKVSIRYCKRRISTLAKRDREKLSQGGSHHDKVA